MDKTYDPQTIEANRYQTWEEAGYFKPDHQKNPAYCIAIPPPNVTGSLHMGHGFQDTLMDTLIRYHRMKGHNTLWQVGFDHAGIATQMVVERQLLAENKTRHELGREEFVKKIWEWKNVSGGRITNQLKQLGCSIDWERERFTMDEQLSKAVNKVFIDLYDEGLIYRGKRLVNWDPTLLTAISDLEVISEEKEGSLWHIRYPLANTPDQYLIVATTRPETLLGDTAVAVHPDDERYQQLIGQSITLPLTRRTIPIIADPYVDPEFGTGCVKITPAHDFNDNDMGQRHDLPLINIFTPDAHINENAPEAYQGMERFAARKQIVKDLEAAKLLEKIEPHTLKIPRGDRSGSVIEPYLTDQWFVKTKPLAKPAIDAVKKGDIKFFPETWENTYYQWMENIEDWCISRQLWWGHRIPAWYDDDNNIYVGETEAAVRKKHQLNDDVNLHQDVDVLDTWFSSALWPFSTLGWPEKTPDYKTFYPTGVLISGFDIIFFWIARMIMMGLKFTNQIPFKHIYITGLIRDQDGQKMSKTKGNVIDPLDLIHGIDLDTLLKKRTQGLMQPQMAEKIRKSTQKQFPDGIAAFGTDALRFTYCALATTGRDIRFELGRLEGYRNFCNKLWNATRYVLMNTEDHDTGIGHQDLNLGLPERWILSRLENTIKESHRHIEQYRFDLLAHALYDFTWNEFCDWYLELSKPALLGDASDDSKRATRHTLVNVLETLLRLLHPIMPYITEEIWQQLAPLAGKEAPTIMLQPFPEFNEDNLDQDAESATEWLKQIIIGIRTIRAEMNISPKKPLPVLFYKADAQDKQRIENNADYLTSLAKLDTIQILKDTDTPPASATALAGEMQILIPIAGLIDKDAEKNRLTKEIEKMNIDLTRSEIKLSNPNFVDKAPQAVVEKERAQIENIKFSITQLEEKLKAIDTIG